MTGNDDRTGSGGPEQHRTLREMLGAHALGGLDLREELAVRAHLDGCPHCRAELAELAPLAAALQLVDPDGVPAAVTPPPDLGARIAGQVAQEQTLRNRRARRDRRSRVLAAAAAVAVLAAGTSTALRLQQDDGAGVVVAAGQEQLALRPEQAGVSVSSAVLVPHTWGLEVQLTMTGVTAGERYRAVAVDRDGRGLPAGEFLGVSDRPVVCNMQAALLRTDASAFLVLDEAGRTVARADLPA